MTTTATRGLGWTAWLVLCARARESRRPDALFRDPFAEAMDAMLDDPADRAAVDRVLDGPAADYLALRTRFFDDHLHAACLGGRDQVVLVAAGLDSRAERLAWPAGTHLFELDDPDVLDRKRRHGRPVADGVRRTFVPVDLRDDWTVPLRAAGLAPGRSTAWLVEGLLVYLAAESQETLLRRLTASSGPDSWLGMSRSGARAGVGGDGAMRAVDVASGAAVSSRWTASPDGPDVAGLLGRYGWLARSHTVGPLAEAWGRPLPDRPGPGRGPAPAFFTAVRRPTTGPAGGV